MRYATVFLALLGIAFGTLSLYEIVSKPLILGDGLNIVLIVAGIFAIDAQLFISLRQGKGK